MNRIKNAKKQTIDGILFLQGVFKSDCDRIEDFFHERLLHGTGVDAKIFDKIPLVFEGLDTWPKSTNLLCWNCCRNIKGRPWFEPQSIDPMNKGKVGEFIPSDKLKRESSISNEYCINARGNFCSPNCVMRYTLTYSRDLADRLNKISMLLFVHEIFTGRNVPDIAPAPLISDRIEYGGSLSDQEYQKKIDDANAQYLKPDENFVNNCKMYFSKLVLED